MAKIKSRRNHSGPRNVILKRLFIPFTIRKFFLLILAAFMSFIVIGLSIAYVDEKMTIGKESHDYATLVTTLETIKPELERVSPAGSVWTLEKYCEYGHVAFGKGDRACSAHLVASIKAVNVDDAIAISRSLDSKLRTDSDHFSVKGAFIIRDPSIYSYASKDAFSSNLTVVNTSFTGCGAGYIIKPTGYIDVSIGCSGSAAKEYFPVRN
jgi:hypothetical protein